MPGDKYSAIWVSHSSIADFLKCPRAYFLRNVYKNERNHKINVVTPALSLGMAVHETLEGLLAYKAEERFVKPLRETFQENWKKVSGKAGGFTNESKEAETKARALAMIARVDAHRGPLVNKAVKLPPHANDMPPNFYLSEADNIILSGKIDWLEYLEQDDSVRIIDFKTGKYDEDENSLQLPIYALLLNALQKRKVSGAAYWYLDRENEPKPVQLPEIAGAKTRVLEAALRVKEARGKNAFACPRGAQGCMACQPFEKILKGEAEYIGLGGYNQELYVV